MMTVLVHVGYHKTGTTWLQRELFDRPERGFCPLPFGARTESSKSFGVLWLDTAGFEWDPEEARRVARAAQAGCSGVPVVSNERLCGHPYSGGYDSQLIADRILETLPDARVLIVIREQVASIASIYLQYLKEGGARPLEAFLEPPAIDRSRPRFDIDYYCYDRLIGYYVEEFGTSNVLVLPYEMFQSNAQQFLDSIAEYAGVSLAGDLPVARRHNESHGAATLATRWLGPLLRTESPDGYNPLALRHSPRTIAVIRRRLHGLIPSRIEKGCMERLHERLRGYSRRFAASNARTSDLTGLALGALGYAMPGDAHAEDRTTGVRRGAVPV